MRLNEALIDIESLKVLLASFKLTHDADGENSKPGLIKMDYLDSEGMQVFVHRLTPLSDFLSRS